MRWQPLRGLVWPFLAIFVLALVLRPDDVVRAGGMSNLRDYLTLQRENLSTGEMHQLFFQPSTSLVGSGNKVTMTFPIDQSGLWCHTAGGDLTVDGITDPVGGTEGATALPGTLTAACVKGNNSTVGDKITISGINPINSGATYGVAVSSGTIGKLGTPAAENNIIVTVTTNDGSLDVDLGYLAVAILSNDRITVTAAVISATPPSNPIVQFKGRASKNTTVHIVRDGTAIQQAATDSVAKFDLTLTNQPTGQHTYKITADDTSHRAHTSVTFALNLTLGSTTLVTGIFLGPTIAVDKTSVKLGEVVTITGRTAPNSTVTLTVSSDPVTFQVSANSDGDWQKAVNTTLIGTGSHQAIAQALSTDNTMSEDSALATFSVNPLQPCDGKPSADLNCDNEVNLTDFSIMLYFWQATNPSNARADINHDGQVTIVDFSIMLYQWTD